MVQVQIPFLRHVEATCRWKPLKIDTLVWLLENCSSLEDLNIAEGFDMNSNENNSSNDSKIALDSSSLRATVRYLAFSHTFNSDEDPYWLPLFDIAFKNLTYLRMSVYGDKPAAANRFFAHLFQVCQELKRLVVWSFCFSYTDLKSLDKANLPSQLKATINLRYHGDDIEIESESESDID